MAESTSRSTPTRLRAAKACERCSQRKIKCDGATSGLPCSRCRSDGVQDCKLNNSRRGRYQRQGRPARPRSIPTQAPEAANKQHDISEQELFSAPPSSASDNRDAAATTRNHKMVDSLHPVPTPEHPPHTGNSDDIPSQSSLDRDPGTVVAQRQGIDTSADLSADAATARPLHNMFEEFLRRQGISDDERAENLGFVLLSESSPLTFALEEAQKGRYQRLPGGVPQAARDSNSDMLGNNLSEGRHPSHMTSHDIAYLQSKGAFDLPEPIVLEALIHAFITRFHPLYSIVDIEDLQLLHRQQKLPWILLHGICLIGATFCDATIIHQSSFKTRWSARRIFYNKTKAIFDLGYETNKIVLLQSALMLTFWGPHMKTYWNPSTWVHFATTIAASLGIHRSLGLDYHSPKDRKLLRRLWWTLLARDASCATLLGRPFRIRTSQCNADPLTVDDFNRPDTTGHSDEIHALYQIHSSRLSLILRQIYEWHSNGDHDCEKQSRLHAMLQAWHEELPTAVDWTRQSDQKNIFANGLKIMYHHHMILLYLGNPGKNNGSIETPSSETSPSAEIVSSAAQTISSSALSLMVNSSVSSMPHEVFTGFFLAGVVFYRQTQHQRASLAQLQRSALDNCQMILNEARENCDAAQWMMRVFDFLLSGTSESKGHEIPASGSENTSGFAPTSNGGNRHDSTTLLDFHPEAIDFSMPSMDWDYSLQGDSQSLANDFFFLPDLYAPAVGDTAEMQFRFQL